MLDERIKVLREKLMSGLQSPFISFSEIKCLKRCGVYLIFNDFNQIVYIGKTTRNGTKRLREMVSDYRSHTFNRKLLKERLNTRFALNISSFPNSYKQEAINKGVLSEAQFVQEQLHINQYIKETLKFKYIEEESELNSLEHFATSIYRPVYND